MPRAYLDWERRLGLVGHVFGGTNISTGAICAIKKSRASLTLKRTLLKYEAKILKQLADHPAIPKLYGYGHFEHFEYLAIELLGNSLSDQDKFARGFSIQEVADIGVQLLSALEHIHSHGIVHRDIKPQNILARYGTDFSHVYIIDFGLARCQLSRAPRQVDLVKERINVVGTLAWASLNAYNGIDLNPRDDLESLAFILLYLLRGNLPWHKLCRAGTAVARMPQIRSKMLSWNGARLGEGYPSGFGELLDYARCMGFDEPIDYERFRVIFKKPYHSELKIERNMNPDPMPVIAKEYPAAPGDLVLVQIDMWTSVEGDTFRDDNSSYLPNLSLSGESWKAPFRPAIILSRKVNEGGRYSFWLIPLTKLTHKGGLSLKEFGVDCLPDSLSNLSAYVFPRALEIYSLPSQAQVCSRWKLSISALNKLWDKLNNGFLDLNYWATKNGDPDVRHEMRLLMQDTVFHANLLSLDSHPDIEIDWAGVRGWFDECVKVGRRRGWEDGFFWTGHPVDEEDSLDNSYYGNEIWWDFRQQERDKELELGGEDDASLPLIDEVVDSYCGKMLTLDSVSSMSRLGIVEGSGIGK